jgi:hypothetical protein
MKEAYLIHAMYTGTESSFRRKPLNMRKRMTKAGATYGMGTHTHTVVSEHLSLNKKR